MKIIFVFLICIQKLASLITSMARYLCRNCRKNYLIASASSKCFVLFRNKTGRGFRKFNFVKHSLIWIPDTD